MVVKVHGKKYELGKRGCLRWRDMPSGTFHIERLRDGSLSIFFGLYDVDDKAKTQPDDVETGASEIKIICNHCGK